MFFTLKSKGFFGKAIMKALILSVVFSAFPVNAIELPENTVFKPLRPYAVYEGPDYAKFTGDPVQLGVSFGSSGDGKQDAEAEAVISNEQQVIPSEVEESLLEPEQEDQEENVILCTSVILSEAKDLGEDIIPEEPVILPALGGQDHRVESEEFNNELQPVISESKWYKPWTWDVNWKTVEIGFAEVIAAISASLILPAASAPIAVCALTLTIGLGVSGSLNILLGLSNNKTAEKLITDNMKIYKTNWKTIGIGGLELVIALAGVLAMPMLTAMTATYAIGLISGFVLSGLLNIGLGIFGKNTAAQEIANTTDDSSDLTVADNILQDFVPTEVSAYTILGKKIINGMKK